MEDELVSGEPVTIVVRTGDEILIHTDYLIGNQRHLIIAPTVSIYWAPFKQGTNCPIILKANNASFIKDKIQFSMGSSSSAQTPSRFQFDPRPWTLVGEGDNYSILRNNSTGEELEQYLHTATDAKGFDHLKNMFEYRLEKDYIVASKFFREETRNQMCSTFFQGYIYTERVPLRMNQIKDLPFPDTLHLVNSVLRGFRELYAKMGPFEVNQHMVGINGDARVKVWFSQDFGRDRPDHQGLQLQQRTMVTQIMEMVDKNIDRRTQPESITHAVLRGGSPTFEQALMQVNDYTVRHLVSVPPFLASIAELRQRGFFKKMLPKGRSSVGSINVPLQPSINRSLAFASRSMLQAGDEQPPPVNWNVPIPGFLPIPTSVTTNQPILTTYPNSPLPLLSPLSIPLAEASSQRTLLHAQNYDNQLIHRVSPITNQLGVPQTQYNHLQFVGKEPLMSLNQNYPPPADYSVLHSPPPHLRGHKTEVKSWISPPIQRQRSRERLVEREVRGVSPVRPIVQPMTTAACVSQVNFPKSPIAPIINRSPAVSAPVSTPTPHFPRTGTTTQQRTVSFGVDNHNQNYNHNHHSTANNVIIIPDKIQLTLTSLSDSGPFGASSETFVIAPNQTNMHSGLIKEIINHTLGLQSCLKQGAYHNPTVINTFYQDPDNDIKALSQATTSNYSEHVRQERHNNYNYNYNSFETPQRGYEPLDGGYTDPTLLRAMKVVASAIDSQASVYNHVQPRYDTIQSYAVKTTTVSPTNQNSWSSAKSQNSSPQIMAIINQALETGRRETHKKTSYISDVQSVDYDSRHGSAIRS